MWKERIRIQCWRWNGLEYECEGGSGRREGVVVGRSVCVGWEGGGGFRGV